MHSVTTVDVQHDGVAAEACASSVGGANVMLIQMVAHSPGVYMAQPWNGSCSDTSRLEAIAQVRHPDVLVLPL